MINRLGKWISGANGLSYVVFFVTARCNAKCPMCFYMDNMNSNKSKEEMTIDEYEKITKSLGPINILGISGGEPFLRNDLNEIIKVAYKNSRPLVVDCPTHGFFTQNVLRQVEDVVKHCPSLTMDVQLSFDGPEKTHNEIRGLKDGFNRLKETYKGLVELKKHYKNLRVKACVVYSHFNKDQIEELFDIFNHDFLELDRVIFSVVHGTAYKKESYDFDIKEYFRICDDIRNRARVKNVFDLHSLFTLSLRMLKNDYLDNVLKNKGFYQTCKAGKRVLVIGETGNVYPCEPLWHPVGNVREAGYDIQSILRSKPMEDFQKKIICEKCNCNWGLPMSNAILYTPGYYPKLLTEMGRIFKRSLQKDSSKRVI